MKQLATILHMFIGSVFAGVAIVVALVTGYGTFWILIGGAIGGYILAIPLSVILARRLDPD